MSEPRSLRICRPYQTEDEYLAAEAWSIDTRSILLIDQPELPQGEIVRFEIVLDDGSKPIRAEGVVYKKVKERRKRPGGLRVKLKRMGAQTKAFIDRAVAHKKAQRSIPPPAPPGEEPAPLSLEPVSETTPGEIVADSSPHSSPDASSEGGNSGAAEDTTSAGGETRSKVKRVDAPPNRDELLSRLRDRAARLQKTAALDGAEEESA